MFPLAPAPSSAYEYANIFAWIDACPRSPLLLHGRQMPWLLHNHHRLLTRPNRCYLWRLLNGSMSTYWRQGTLDGGMQFPEEVGVAGEESENDGMV